MMRLPSACALAPESTGIHPWWQFSSIGCRRWRASIEPGAWEAVAAARFARPGVEKGFATRRADPGNIRVPTLIVGGEHELLREPGCWQDLHRAIPGSELKVYQGARHCPHIEFADDFNALALDFLGRHQFDAPLTACAQHR